MPYTMEDYQRECRYTVNGHHVEILICDRSQYRIIMFRQDARGGASTFKNAKKWAIFHPPRGNSVLSVHKQRHFLLWHILCSHAITLREIGINREDLGNKWNEHFIMN